MKILLLDDDAFLRDMYAQKFMESKYVVLTASNGQEALDILKNESDISLVLLDIVMPNMDGMEFLRNAVQLENSKSVNFIVLSNQSESNDKKIALELGAKDYIVKAESVPDDVVKKVELAMSN